MFTCLEKSYISGPLLNFFKSEVESLLTAVVKYCDYLDYNLEQIRQSQGINEELLKDNSIYPLPFNTATIHEAYKMPREQSAVEEIKINLNSTIFTTLFVLINCSQQDVLISIHFLNT